MAGSQDSAIGLPSGFELHSGLPLHSLGFESKTTPQKKKRDLHTRTRRPGLLWGTATNVDPRFISSLTWCP